MGWIQKLYETYERCATAPQFAVAPPVPVFHTSQQAQIEIVLDGGGSFLRARVQKEKTVVPATEASAGRSGTKAPPHPLCDRIRYCASDYPRFAQGTPSFYPEYHALLKTWCQSAHNNPKAQTILKYVERGTVVEDLVRAGVLVCSDSGVLLTEWRGSGPVPEILKLLKPKPKTKLKDQGDAFVRWRIEVPSEVPSEMVSAVWEDPETCNAWIQFCRAGQTERGLCLVTGERVPLAANHPMGIRYEGDRAKLISSNDKSGFTYRGRFTSDSEACGVGSEATQKAHSALQWLIERQRDESKERQEQVFVAWSVGGQRVPDPMKSTADLFLSDEEQQAREVEEPSYAGDAGQVWSRRLKRLIAGYSAKLEPTDDVVVIGLDSATKGRMCITFYRELKGSEFLARIQHWHESHAWAQVFSADLQKTFAPAPKDIAEAAFGREKKYKANNKLRKAVVESLLPCIVDGRPVPRQLVEACVRRASILAGSDKLKTQQRERKKWEWEKCLGIACAMYRGNRQEEGYSMSLEESRTSRDYLFGRLLAIGEHIERRALDLADETRDTNAAKLMQRFAESPLTTWRTIEPELRHYRARLRAKWPKYVSFLDQQLDNVMTLFSTGDFVCDSKLSGEFLLGFHCQRAALWRRRPGSDGKSAADLAAPEGE